MADIFNTKFLDEKLMKQLSADQASWIYNGLDCCVTAEVFNQLQEQLDDEEESVKETYATALNKLAPFTEMSLRGVRIDEAARQESLKKMQAQLDDLDAKFQRIMREVFDGEINWNSPVQVQGLLYNSMGLKPIRKRNAKGVYAPTVNEDALEQLKVYLFARPVISFILKMRSIRKSIGFLKTQIDPDNRMRTSYNIAGTNTGRLSSAMNDFGTGTNLQNVDRSLRQPFVADDGMILVNIDLEQADGRNVGAICHNLFYDFDERDIARILGKKSWNGPVGPEFASAYLDACESGDLHTTVCNMTWPGLDWPDDPAGWKEFCDGVILHGQDSYRQVAKKLGHGTNYYGTPRTMAKHAHAPVPLIDNFQHAYFGAFPCIKAWHQDVINRIKTTGVLYNLFGRRRHFFGRGDDASTHRKAIAYSPQSTTGEQIDRGIIRLWEDADPKTVNLLLQVHDSILLQVPYTEHKELIPYCLEKLKIEIELKGNRMFHVPLEAKVGWNWGDFDEKENPYGLAKWKGEECRSKPSPTTRLKDYL